jgi:hypothetical protein
VTVYWNKTDEMGEFEFCFGASAVEQIVGRERRGRVSQLAWRGGGFLIRAAASTPTLDDAYNLNRVTG